MEQIPIQHCKRGTETVHHALPQSPKLCFADTGKPLEKKGRERLFQVGHF